jgi:hypothetical protein
MCTPPYAAAALASIPTMPAPPLALPLTARLPATLDSPLLFFPPLQPSALREPLPKGLLLLPLATLAALPAFPQAAPVAFGRRNLGEGTHCTVQEGNQHHSCLYPWEPGGNKFMPSLFA